MDVSYNDVLNEFVKILHVLNYQKIDNPPDDEYVPEALSILARLVESQIQFDASDSNALFITERVIHETFMFWYEKTLGQSTKVNLAMDMLRVFHPSWSDND